MSEFLPILIVILVLLAVWFGARTMMRSSGARATAAVVGDDFAAFTLEVLANAAKIDERVNEAERQAIAETMAQVKGSAFPREEVDAALARATLNKDQLVAYLRSKGRQFSLAQKTQLLKGVLTVAMADGEFEQREHDIYIAYIEAVGVEHETPPEMLRRLVKEMATGKYS